MNSLRMLLDLVFMRRDVKQGGATVQSEMPCDVDNG
jgi:hypothetical protein